MDDGRIDFQAEGSLGRVVFHRPETGNAFTRSMMRQLLDVLRGAGDLDVVLLTGAGKDFTIGRDRNEPRSPSPADDYRTVVEVSRALRALPGIVVASVQGRAHGFGVNLVLRSDLVIASDDARFELDEARLGFPPMFVMEDILDHLPPKRALDIVLSSREFGAAEALDMGLLSRVAPADRLRGEVDALIGELGARKAGVLAECKRYLCAAAGIPREERSSFALGEVVRFFAEAEARKNQPK